MKTAVILLNLGGPLREADIEPFLFNFFMDKNIIGLPRPLRWMVAKRIARTRSRATARDAYARLNFKSPLLENTQKQAAALQEKLGAAYRVFISMRYWHPLSAETAAQVREYRPDKIVLLPLYPQYSTATTKSSLENFQAQMPGVDMTPVCCYPVLPGFVKASAAHIRAELAKAPPQTRVLFSAHGLPEKTVRAGDPYQKQCEISAAAIAKEAGLADWQICYQSRVGPLKWIGPSTAEALEKAARDKVSVVIYPHSFVSEHVETLVEIDIEYRERAHQLGIPYFGKIETAGTHPDFIAGLAGLVQEAQDGKKNCDCQEKPCRNS